MPMRVCTNPVVSTASGFWVPPEAREKKEGPPWYLPVLLMSACGLLGGYLGAFVAGTVWLMVGKVAADRRRAMPLRVLAGIVSALLGAAGYQAGLTLLAQVVVG